ncbi:MAG: TonB-dependent receptor [Bacteroidota bacterium]
MKNVHLSLAVALLLSCSLLPAQDSLIILTDSTATLPLVGLQSVDAAYETWQVRGTPYAFEQITAPDFNQGLISDPSQLVQGRIAGTQIYNRGGDPNTSALVRVRGLSSLSQRQPLFVIDGVPGAALENLDPNDIASITILKDGASQALYGIRASNGVVLINTKVGQATPGRLAISYTGQVATSSAHTGISTMEPTAFLAAGGWDFGNSTSWMDEVQQSALSHTHGLAVAGATAKTNYRISGNYRDVEGVLSKSGFEQANLRANVQTSLLQDKLKVQLTSAYTDRNSEFGFQEAFRYAVNFNPTAPVFAADAPFPSSTTQFGGYYEMLGLFDGFNPRAIVDLNDRYGKDQVFNGQAFLQYELFPQLQLNARYAYQNHFANERAYYSPQSIFRGNALSPIEDRRGRADLRDLEQRLSVYEFFINYGTDFGNSRLDFTVGTSYSDGSTTDLGFTLFGFDDPTLLEETRRIDSYDTWLDETVEPIDTISSSWATRHSAVFGRLQLSIADQLFVHTALRSEGSSRLGVNNRWGSFPSVGIAWDMSKKMANIDLLKLRMSFGLTGSVPDQAGLSAQFNELFPNGDGTFSPLEIRQANPNLQWEEKSELNLGVDFRSGRFQAYFEWYNREVGDWVDFVPGQFPSQLGNEDAIQSTGIELGADAVLVNKKDVSYQMGLRLATFQSEFSVVGFGIRRISSSCCNSGDPIMAAQEGEELGEILAPVIEDVDEQGSIIFADLNGDGVIRRDPFDVYTPESDLAAVGNGLPSMELGITQQFRYHDWELSAFIRGAFGHSLYNVNRRFYETQFLNRVVSNYVDTDLRVPGLRSSLYADIYIEKANFLKLDFLSLARSFTIGNPSQPQRLRVSLTAQNILLSSSYTGADPEPSFEDIGSTDNGGLLFGRTPNPLMPGIDRRTNYLPARTFTFGVQLTL